MAPTFSEWFPSSGQYLIYYKYYFIFAFLAKRQSTGLVNQGSWVQFSQKAGYMIYYVRQHLWLRLYTERIKR